MIPRVADFNPGLPDIGMGLNSHYHTLKLSPELSKAVKPDGIFASIRSAKTLHDKLVHGRLPVEVKPDNEYESGGEVLKPVALGGATLVSPTN